MKKLNSILSKAFLIIFVGLTFNFSSILLAADSSDSASLEAEMTEGGPKFHLLEVKNTTEHIIYLKLSFPNEKNVDNTIGGRGNIRLNPGQSFKNIVIFPKLKVGIDPHGSTPAKIANVCDNA